MGLKKTLNRVLPSNKLGDSIYAHFVHYRTFGQLPSRKPERFNEHLFSLKVSGALYDPLVQFVTDKEHAKLYISAVVGEKYTIDTIRVIRSQQELKEYRRPETCPCVIKPTHLSNEVIIWTDESQTLDFERIGKWFNINHYRRTREHNYRYLTPKVIVETFFSDGNSVPKDYKIYCFGGKAKIIQVDADRFGKHTKNFYNTDWLRLNVTCEFPNRILNDEVPEQLSEMLRVAESLSAPHEFLRVDMYSTSIGVKVGELTFVPLGATGKLHPPETENIWGNYFVSPSN